VRRKVLHNSTSLYILLASVDSCAYMCTSAGTVATDYSYATLERFVQNSVKCKVFVAAHFVGRACSVAIMYHPFPFQLSYYTLHACPYITSLHVVTELQLLCVSTYTTAVYTSLCLR
jgi:hypothetical protein